jgi:hypothetical protein
MLPLEQTPAIVESAARIFQGANLSIYGDDGPIVGQLGPLFEILARALQSSSAAGAQEEPASRSNG